MPFVDGQLLTAAQLNDLESKTIALKSDLANATDPAKGAALVGGNAQVVASIAGLRALLKSSSSKNAFAAGYYAAGDGGGGSYWLDTADSISADNGGTVIVASDGGRWKLVVSGPVSIKQFGCKIDGSTDDYAAFQSAANAVRHLYIPESTSYCKILTTVTLTGGAHIEGAQQQKAIIGAWGVDAFTINGSNGDCVTLENLELRGYSATGVIDAKTNAGIKSFGLTGSHVNYLTIKRCFLRGWLNCVDWQYTWASVLDNVTTLNCTNGLRLFGQSVNNTVIACSLGANGGNASILTVKDGATQGEGLMVVGSLLAQGNYGVLSDGFLMLSIVGCIIDLIAINAVDLTNAPSFMLSSSWVYAANYGVNFNSLGSAVNTGASLSGNYITSTASGGKAVYVGGNNQGVSITGGELTAGVNSRLVHVDGLGVSVTGVRGVNGGANPSIFFNGADCHASNNSGSMAAQWNVGVPSQGGMAVATAAFVGVSGTASMLFGCSVTRTGVGAYSVAFLYPLVSDAYAPIVTIDRGGNGAMGYSVTSQIASGFSFTTTNQSGTAQDPANIWLAVFS